MKKFLLTALMTVLVVSMVITGLLPAFAEEATGIVDAGTLEMAAINASVDVDAIGANYDGMIVGTNTTGASIGADYVVPGNPGDMSILAAGTKYTADNLPEGAIGITTAEEWAAILVPQQATDGNGELVWNVTYVDKKDEEGNIVYEEDGTTPVKEEVKTPVYATTRNTKTYVLLADITVSATLGADHTRFAGTLYGNGYTITTSVPLFAYSQMAKFYDLTIAGDVTGAAALTVIAFGGSFYNIKNTANVTNNGQIAAGLVAGQNGGSPLNGVTTMVAGGPIVVDRCVNTGAITGYSACGIGNFSVLDKATITITNTYNTGKIYATAYPAAGISGVLRCASTDAVETGNIVLRNVKNEGEVSTNNTQINAGIVGHITNGKVDQTRATVAIFENVVNTGKIHDNGKAGSSAGILGQASAGATSDTAETYYASDLRANVTVKMINVCNAGAVQGRWASGLLARGGNTATYLTNCTNSGTITWSGSNNGAIAGFFSNIAASTWEQTIVMKDCVNTADISGYRASGIIALQNIRGTVYMTDVRNEGDVSSNYWAGGFCVTLPQAYSKTVLTNCQNDGDIIVEHANANRAGGFYAIQQNGVLVFDKCLNNGTVNASKLALYAGGYIGSLQTKTGSRVDFYNSVNAGTIYGKADSYAGGFYGYSGEQTYAADAPQIFENCENKGYIDARWAGGFAGATGAAHCVNATNCTNSGEVKSVGANSGTGGAGGFFANVQQGSVICTLNFENCLNSGTISGDRIGGLWAIWVNPTHTGCNNKGNTDVTNITNSANTGALNCAGYYAGGAGALVHGEVNVDGWLNAGTITSTYPSNTYGYAAGMIGLWNYAFGTVTNAMNTGAITAPMTLGRAVIGNNADGKDSVDVNNNGDAIFGPTAAGLVAEVYGWSTNVTITGINTGIVTGQNAGGIVGVATRYTQINLNDCANFGSVISTAAPILDDPATADVDESKAIQLIGVGGIIGLGNNQYMGTGLRLNGCINAGEVYSENFAAGGLVGASVAATKATKIRGCMNLGTVTCVNGVAAGVIGFMENSELPHTYNRDVLDEEGNPTYEVKLDDNGEPVLDENGEPVMVKVTESVTELYPGELLVDNCYIGGTISGASAYVTVASVDLFGPVAVTNNLFVGTLDSADAAYAAENAELTNNYAIAAIDGATVATAEQIVNGELAAALGEGWAQFKACDDGADFAIPALAYNNYYENIFVADHVYDEIGYDEEGHYVACHCGAFEEGVEKVAHTMSDWTVAEGGHTATCTGCEYTVAGECEWADVEGKDATCTEDGYTAHKVCSVCGAEEGKEVIPAAHQWADVDGKDATCDADGYTAYKVCSVCGAEEGKTVIAAKGHNYVDGKCTVCGADDPNYVPPVVEPEVAPGEIVEIDGVLYYMENGKKTYKGLFLYTDGYYYYAKSSGALQVNGTVNAAKTSCDLPTGSYRFDELGRAATGIFTSNNTLRYYENGKSVQKGFFKHTDGNYYYAKEGGWLVLNAIYMPLDTNCDLPANVKYRFGEDGAILQGFHLYPTDGTTRYYVNGKTFKAGLMKHTDGYYYYVKHSGILCTNMTVYATFSTCDLPINCNYKFDEQGRAYEGIYETAKGLRYYRNGKGAFVGLFQHTDGEYYYAAGSGYLKVATSWYVDKFDQDTQTTVGTYYFDAEGKAYQGVNQNKNGANIYYVNGIGTNVGIYEYEGNYYLTQSGGKLLPNKTKYNVKSVTGCDLPAGYYDSDANGMVTNIYVDGVKTPIADYIAAQK